MAGKIKIDIKKLSNDLSGIAKAGIDFAKDSTAKAKEAVAASAETIVRSIDQTGDGRFDFNDISEISHQLQEKQQQAQMKRDFDALNPIFKHDLSDGRFLLSRMIRVTEIDKKHASKEICKGSIGHQEIIKDLRLVTIYSDKIDEWNLELYPDKNQEFYYVSPVNSQKYIAIDYYFNYLRDARVGELQKIAQNLGATFFKVIIREEKKTLHKKREKAAFESKNKAKGAGGKVQAEQNADSHELLTGEIMAQISFEGHAPIRPELVLYKNEPQIKSLISMRLENPDNGVKEQHLTLKCSSTTGITKKLAATIDAAFSAMKWTGTTTFTSEAQNEERHIFEYDIRF